MPEYTLNLIRDRVPHAQRRRAIFLSVLAYLLIGGIGLAYVANHATRVIQGGINKGREYRSVSDSWADEHPDHPDLNAYERDVQSRLDVVAAALAAVDTELESRVFAAGVLHWLQEPLPKGAFLLSFEQPAGSQTFTFDVAVPVSRQKQFNATGLLTGWREHPQLSERVQLLRFVISQREVIDRQSLYVWSYEGTFAGGAQ